ncbi:MAG TPA: condensation domain-containing protein, partial [Allocoleopsis sp.]
MTLTSSPAIAGFRLSPQQHRLWSLQQSAVQLSTVAQAAIHITGTLQANQLQSALLQVVQRHEILRTHFPCLPEMQMPLQVIETVDVDWLPDQDLRTLDAETQAARLVASWHALAALDGLVRSQLLQLAEQEWILHLALPSLSADGYTLRQLVRELRDAYANHPSVPKKELPQYADLAEWQHELLT